MAARRAFHPMAPTPGAGPAGAWETRAELDKRLLASFTRSVHGEDPQAVDRHQAWSQHRPMGLCPREPATRRCERLAPLCCPTPGTPSLGASRGHLPLMDQRLKETTWAFQPLQSIHLLFIMKSVWIGFLLLEIRVLTEHTAFPSHTESCALTEDRTSGRLGGGETGGTRGLNRLPWSMGSAGRQPRPGGTHGAAVSCLALGEPHAGLAEAQLTGQVGAGTVGGWAAWVSWTSQDQQSSVGVCVSGVRCCGSRPQGQVTSLQSCWPSGP